MGFWFTDLARYDYVKVKLATDVITQRGFAAWCPALDHSKHVGSNSKMELRVLPHPTHYDIDWLSSGCILASSCRIEGIRMGTYRPRRL